MRRVVCAACAGELTDFLNLGSTPLADVFPPDASVTETRYPLTVAVCQSCWLVQLRAVIEDEQLYGDGYAFRTASSPAAVRYFEGLARDLLKQYGKQRTVEIACNDGTLLRHFADARCPVLGIEPVPGAAADAAQKGVPVAIMPFSRQTAREIRGSHGPAGLILAMNVAAHVADPLDFLGGVCELLAEDGAAVIEFQDLEALIAGCQFDHVYHEHRFYYSLPSFTRLAGQCGLAVSGWERTGAQGGSLRVHLRRGDGVGPSYSTLWLERTEIYAGMQERAECSRRALRGLIGAEREDGRVVAGYGASAKSCTLLNFCGLGPADLQWVEDITPGKIGRVTPGSHIPVRAPNRKPDTYLLTSWNYAGHVIRSEAMFLAGGGRLIIPGAVPVIV